MLSHRRTKIVATIGPATHSLEGLEACLRAGMNVARLNFSHGTHADHAKTLKWVRELSNKHDAPIAVLQDLQGPKIRIGKLKNDAVILTAGESVRIDINIEVGDEKTLSTDFKELPMACQKGTKILLDDGLLELKVANVGETYVDCEIIYGGKLKTRKGMNLPGANLPVDALTAKDLEDLKFGLDNGVDYVALSFVRKASDIRGLRDLIDKHGSQAKIIAKIEMLEALNNLVEIIELSDAVMVARGDLAIEIGAAQLPLIQKRIIAVANEIGRPVITATQMLESMVENPSPTRAEITDIANAVLDGSDALMLSAETASGKYPGKCIETMHNIILEVERTGHHYYDITLDEAHMPVPETIGAGASLAALKLNASIIVCLSTTGKTAALISRFRPKAKVFACTPKLDALNRMELVWGVQTLRIPEYKGSDEAIENISAMLVSYGIAKPGDDVVMTLGMPVHKGAKTNTIRVFQIPDDLKISAPTTLPLRFQS